MTSKREKKIEARTKVLWDTCKITPRHEEGLYRHYIINLPAAHSWVDIITWPGHLTITGDLSETYTFKREDDMLRCFFHATHGPDYRYWEEKLVIPEPYKATHTWDEDWFREDVKTLQEEGWTFGENELEEVEYVDSQEAATAWGVDNECGYELGTRYTTDFLRACNLIALFAHHYRTYVRSMAALAPQAAKEGTC